ncbi:hypothetical protein [Streptomyces sp. V1I1]|uniref:hypothetical protein n=1 Tax=Streptomyces sp. V1I1 TaxID=3042272 RepID=UPI00277DE6FD|nr:hypothetical protein [Streptomyces sp. V1I1]MDQ0945995.1 hypothetical protein [Streptomyces sp. V1I1]
MTPRPDAETVDKLKAAVLAAKKERDETVAAAEKKLWQTIGKLGNAYHGAKTDIAEALGLTRDAVLKQVKKHS